MKARTFLRPLTAILFLAGVAIVFFLGCYFGSQRFVDFSAAVADGELSHRVEILSCLRTGDNDRAIEILEMGMDNLVLTLPLRKEFSTLPRKRRIVISAAKLYRTAFPLSPDSRPELLKIYSEIPPLSKDHAFCSAALRKVSEMTATSELPTAK